jgi:hypothetical protein
LKKLRIYAAFDVAEVWRYDGKGLQMYTLKDGVYEEVAGSNLLPNLTGRLLAEFIELSKTVGRTEARHAFSRRLVSQRENKLGNE